MERISKIFSSVSPVKNTNHSYQMKVNELWESEKIKELRQQNSEIEQGHLSRSLSAVQQAVIEEENCKKCNGLNQCSNLMVGYKSTLKWTGTAIVGTYQSCSLQQAREEQKEREKLIQSHHIPKEILSATFSELEKDVERIDGIKAILDFCLNVEPGKPGTKGLYFYGLFGVGKSYLMSAGAKLLSERGISSLMVYTPEFFREIKESLQDNTTQQKIDVVKKVPVLILDDIGAETLSPWVRDEVLGAILQYRVSENLPVLYTSNYNFTELLSHLSYSQKAGTEMLKAMRIMERIQHYTECYEIGGDNRRMG
jgi:primosomal protein DnaI